MCLAIPARIVALHGENMATVEIGGIERDVSLALVDADVGDYVIVHVGIAISTLDEDEAVKTLALFAELDEMEDGSPA
jgi:hydrogenase expression/formation protein HypC